MPAFLPPLEMTRKIVTLSLPLLLLIGITAFPQSASHKTVWDGIYTEDQANRGRAAYLENCSPCHGADLEGLNGVRLSGPEFMERWREFDVGSLFDFISKSMPRQRPTSPNRPGSLPIPTYTDIITHILRSNHFPSGARELTEGLMPDYQIEGKDGPKPLPNGALVQLVGCLTPARQQGGWRLLRASEPARTSTSKSSTEAELKLAETKELGGLEFRLTNIDIVGDNFDPKSHVGQKIQTKGYLTRQPGNERIDITSLEVASQRCY
jgi:quinoprotein glucose dehydrogenase